jgi:peptidyl-prolyl cis-trans isomerase SurA
MTSPRNRMRTAFALVLPMLAAAPALAQVDPAPQPGEELWDGVVAVVGDTVLLRSEVLLAVEQARAAGEAVPEDPAAYERYVAEVVEDRIADLLLVVAARAAGMQVGEVEVQTAVDEQIRQVRERFPSQEAFRQALAESGRTPEQYREEMARQFRDQTLVQRFVRQRIGTMPPPPVPEAELRAFFDANRERLGQRPATVSFQQVIVRPVASDTARQAAIRTMEEVVRELARGTDFDVVARRFSMDGTRERGGDLGWFRQGQMVREFDRAVFAMRPGQVSPVIETEFGFHVIRLDRVRGPERQARHILIRPTITPADVERARQRADSVATAIQAGASATELAARYGTPDEARFQRDVPLDRLPPAYQSALMTLPVGGVAGPLRIDAGSEAAFAVARVTARQTAGEWTLDDQRTRIRELLQEQRMVMRMVEELRRDTHVALIP